MSSDKQACKVFCGGLSWETSSERLRAYFENFGVVREAFVSYNRNNGRPRGFGFVVFESSDVADKVVATKHTIDRREVECKKAVPKEENAASSPPSSNEGGVTGNVNASAAGGSATGAAGGRTRKVFVGGLAPGVDEKLLRQHFEQFGVVEDAVVMYDHDNKRPRGFGFVTFASEDSVDKVFGRGVMQSILDKQIEIKPAVPRDQMPPTTNTAPNHHHGRMAPPPPYIDQPRGGYGRGGYGEQQQNQPYGHYGGPPGYGAPPPMPKGGQPYGPKAPRQQPPPPQQQQMQGPGSFPNFSGGRGTGPRAGQAQQYMNAGLAPGFGGGPRNSGAGVGMFNNTSKLPTGYELYAASLQPNGNPNQGMGFPNNTSAAALYNLANFQPQLNNMQGQNGTKLNSAAFGNQLNLKALGALASTLGAFPAAGGQEGYQDPSGAYGGQEEYAEAAAAAAAAAAGGLSVQSDYGFGHDAGFTTSPAPGWSS